MTVIFKRQTPERTKLLRKAFKAHNVAQKFLVHLYNNGYLERINGRFVLDKILRGKVPKRFDIHHIIPLSGGGTNALSNLCLMEESLHKFINKHCFDPALKDIQTGEVVEINIPDFPPVALRQDYSKFINQTLQKPNRVSGFRKLLLHPVRKLPVFKRWYK